jgi:hypothetical protein
MKILSLDQMYFLLPDDFNGNFNDALREVIKYRESLQNKKDFPPMEQINNTENKSLFELFLDATKNGHKLYGKMFVGEYNGEEWVNQRDKEGTDEPQ